MEIITTEQYVFFEDYCRYRSAWSLSSLSHFLYSTIIYIYIIYVHLSILYIYASMNIYLYIRTYIFISSIDCTGKI